jgi:F0F1-type ATP synthase assembly protein I
MLGTAVAEMVAAVVLGVWLDAKFETEPWLAMAGAMVGITGGVVHLIYIGRRSARGGKPPGAGKGS